jgi:hypothetical protein
MTENTPPQDEPPNDSNQWWSTPASTGSGTPLTGTDPTIMGGAQSQGYGTPGYGQQPYTAQPYNPQPYAQSASQPTPIPQPPSQPAPQPIVQPQPGYTGQQQQPQFTGGYPQQPSFGARPPQKSNNAALWVIGGVVGLVVVIGIVIAIVVASTGHDGGTSVLGKKKVDGNYSMSNVTNACSLIDLTVLSKWAPNPKANPTHTERQPDSTIGGGSLECNGTYDGAGKYGSDSSEMSLDAEFQSEYGSPDYNMWKDEDTKTTGSGRTSGDIAGIGQQAYYAIEQENYSSFNVLDYTCATMDSNVSVQIKFHIDTDSAPSTDDAATTCKDQLKKVLSALHK